MSSGSAITNSLMPVRTVSGSGRGRLFEQLIHGFLFLCAAVSVITTVSIVIVLLAESVRFFFEVSIFDFLTDTKWTPLLKPQHFGILPLLCGTMLVAVGSSFVSIPVGLGTAIYLSEYAPPRLRELIKPVVEVLAGIPSVVYGYFAVVTISPFIRSIFPSAGPFNAASACIVVGIMTLPMIISLSEDALRAVPQSLRQGASALGATKYDVTVQVVVPAAMSGIVASFLLAISRAVGETMAVTLAAGATPRLTLNPLESIQTMTACIIQISQGDTPANTVEYRTIFAVGLALFIATLLLNLLAQWFLTHVREKYE